MPYIFALSYAQIPSLHSRGEDANKRFLGLFLTLLPAFFPCYLHKEIALLLLDYNLQLYESFSDFRLILSWRDVEK